MTLADCGFRQQEIPTLPFLTTNPGRKAGVLWFYGVVRLSQGARVRCDERPSGGAALASGYCVKCKASREIKDPQQITMKNGRPATQGTCPVCGTKIFKIGAST
jgi:uncharacterized protein DUF5679